MTSTEGKFLVRSLPPVCVSASPSLKTKAKAVRTFSPDRLFVSLFVRSFVSLYGVKIRSPWEHAEIGKNYFGNLKQPKIYTERQRQTDRETDRQRQAETGRDTDREGGRERKGRERERERERRGEGEGDGDGDGEGDREGEGETEKDTERDTETQREREKERDKETERQTERQTNRFSSKNRNVIALHSQLQDT